MSANEDSVFYLLPVIDEFKKRHPLIVIDVQRDVASRIPKEIMARAVELAVISCMPKDSSVKSFAVSKDELVLIFSPKDRLANKKTVSVKGLGIEIFSAHNAPSPYRERVIDKFAKHRTKLNIAIEMPSSEEIKRLVEMGVGVALVPKLTAQSEIENGQLCGLSLRETRLESNLQIVYRRNGFCPPQKFFEIGERNEIKV